jgi:hypothetical protein
MKVCAVISENTVIFTFCEYLRYIVFNILGLLSCSEATNYFLSCVVSKLVSCLDASADQLSKRRHNRRIEEIA